MSRSPTVNSRSAEVGELAQPALRRDMALSEVA